MALAPQCAGKRAAHRMGLPARCLAEFGDGGAARGTGWATRRASLVVPGGFAAVAFEFLRWVAFATRDCDFFLNGLLVMVFSPDVAAPVGTATGASPGWPGVVALTLLRAGKSSAFGRYSAIATARPVRH